MQQVKRFIFIVYYCAKTNGEKKNFPNDLIYWQSGETGAAPLQFLKFQKYEQLPNNMLYFFLFRYELARMAERFAS